MSATALGGQDTDGGGGFFGWIKKNLFDPIDVSGSKRIGFHSHSVTGDASSFAQQNYFGDGDEKYTDQTDVYVRGQKVLGLLNFESRISNSRFGSPNDRRVTFVYESKVFDTKIGDISGSLHNTNSLVSFSKQMSGVMGTVKLGKGYELRLVGSDTKANARTVAVPGNNSAGPYYLPGGNIVDGTLRVRVDDRDKTLGTNYTVDYQTGILNFVDGTIVAPTSVIQATYESYGFNDGTGTIYGASFLMPIHKTFNMEWTAVQQKQKSGSGLGTRTDKFYGYGAPNTPYDLQYEPLIDAAHPLILTVDNLPQILGVDFYFDQFLPFRFYFTRFIPTTSIVQALYTPKPSPGSQANGNKQVYGVAFRWIPMKGLTFQQNFGMSNLDAVGGGVKGTARSSQMEFTQGRLKFRAGITDIPATFSTISSTGFRRNESGRTLEGGYDFGKGLTFRATHTKSRISSPTYSPDGSITPNNANNGVETAGIEYAPAGKPYTLSLTHTKNSFESASGRSSTTSDSLRYGHKFGKVSTSFELSRNRIDQAGYSEGSIPDASTMNSARVNASWETSRWLSMSASYSHNLINGGQGKSTGRDVQLSFDVKPSENLNARVTFNDSTSGFYNYGGYGNGYGYGLGSGGFSNGGDQYGSSSGVRQRGYNLMLHYSPWRALSLDAQLSRQFGSGDNLSNSDLTTMTLGLGYQFSQYLRFNGSLSQQKVSFVSSSGSSDTSIVSFGMSAGPWKRWSWSMDVQRMLSGSNYTTDGSGYNSYNQNLNSVFSKLGYSISDRQRAFIDVRTGATIGYLSSNEENYGVGYEYDLNRYITLVASYRIRKLMNQDPANSAYSYRARSFDVDVAIHF